MTNAERIKRAIRIQIERYQSQTGFAEAAGVSPQYISQLQKRKNPVESLSVEMLEQLFPEIVKISFNWNKTESLDRELERFIAHLTNEEQKMALDILKAAFPPQKPKY